MCLAKLYVELIDIETIDKRQSLISNVDPNADTKTDADAEMLMPRFSNGSGNMPTRDINQAP